MSAITFCCTCAKYGFDGDTYAVNVATGEPSPDIAMDRPGQTYITLALRDGLAGYRPSGRRVQRVVERLYSATGALMPGTRVDRGWLERMQQPALHSQPGAPGVR